MLQSRLGSALILLSLFARCAPARGDEAKPSKTEIARRSRGAVALVEVPKKRGAGSGFCIHASGLFVTNEHVIRGAGGEDVHLVLNSGLENQRIVKARVVREDKDLDLALIQAAGAGDWAKLTLGSDDNLAELSDAVAIGFPYGKGLAAKRETYPEASINAGSITALRRKEGVLDRIQLDVVLNPGNSGGPVLDDTGKVIGVVVAGITGGAQINYAIPVSHLLKFVETPIIDVTPPLLVREALARPVVFTARVATILPGAAEPTLKLLLRGDDEADAREFPMRTRDGACVASALPFKKPTTEELELTARFASGTVSGISEDAPIKVGDKTIRLREIRRIDFGAKPSVLLADGLTRLEGIAGGLDKIEVRVGGQPLKLDLARSQSLQVRTAALTNNLTVIVVASVDGAEVGRVETVLRVQDNAAVAAADVGAVAIVPPELTDDHVVRPLPEPFTDVAQGGGGRYLVFHLPRLRKLAVFDVNAAKVTGYIPLAEDKVFFAAGLDAVVIGLPAKQVLERWGLASLTRELVALPSFREPIQSVVLGHGSNGPVVVNGTFMDLATLRPLSLTYLGKGEAAWGGTARPIPSGDSTLFGSWKSNESPGTAIVFALEGNEVRRYEAGHLGHVVPGPDGKNAFTAKGPVSNRLIYAAPDDAKLGWCLPAARGEMFVSFVPPGDMLVHLPGQPRPIGRIPKVAEGISIDGWAREEFGAWRRLYFVPQANLMIALPPSNDRLVLHRFDVDAALESSGLDYLIIASQPPRGASPGVTYGYQMSVKAKHAPVAYRLETGPPGMEVSAEGHIRWDVPAEAEKGDRGVVVVIKDQAGQEVFHSFTVQVVR